MAAYAALVSLMNITEQILNHPRLSSSLDNYQIQSLRQKLGILLDFVDGDGGIISREEVEDLERQIATAAHEAEDVIESHIADRILAGPAETNSRCSCDLQKVILDMDSIKEKVTKVKEERRLKDQKPMYTKPAASSRSYTSGKTTMVGFQGYLNRLLDELTGLRPGRQIIPIAGMGGIGKTTLAKNAYENLLMVQHFDVRAWVTISQEYSVREILLGTLSCLGESTSAMGEKTEGELGEQLCKVLCGRRYLVVLDDMWSTEVWDKIKFFFPSENNRSRIVVTTRGLDVANYIGSSCLVVSFLDENDSWDLFCESTFAKEGCPPELGEVGRNIVKKCNGLPLSIVVIGGLLEKSPRTRGYWENVEKDLSSILNSTGDNQCLNILSLSYNHLPACLKPCFLYLGIFSEDHEIRVSQLIKLWVAEGFLRPDKEKSLEEVAEGYVKDLIERNLILIRSLKLNGKLKTCKVHDLLRDLCLRIAEKENFFRVVKGGLHAAGEMDRERRIIIDEKNYYSVSFCPLRLGSLARSAISKKQCQMSLNSRLLRVMLNVFGVSPDATLEQVNLRFLESSLRFGGIVIYELPSSISLLWNLQTLIVRGYWRVVAPFEIWEMPQLRHLKCNSVCLPDPRPSGEQDGSVLRYLQTLTKVENFRCSEEVCRRMPNIKKLRIQFHDNLGEDHPMSHYGLHNIGRLNKLESLRFSFLDVPDREDLLQNLKFPSSLKKLDLTRCGLHWDDLTIIGSLPHLEVLKLRWNSVIGPEWNPIEGEFQRLKFLEIFLCSDLIYWNANNSHFPALEKLDLFGLKKLDEIPSGIGEIPTLRDIIVFGCSFSAAISAIKILEEQESFGYEDLRVRVEFEDKMKLEEFREKVELEGFTSQNFTISGYYSEYDSD